MPIAIGARSAVFAPYTDLGLIVKTELDGSQVVFVQSIQSGEPQVGVDVSVVGKNGLTLMKG